MLREKTQCRLFRQESGLFILISVTVFRSSLKDSQQDSGGSLELPAHLNNQQRDSITPKGDLLVSLDYLGLNFFRDPSDPVLAAPAWADFDTAEPVLPPSESGFFSKKAGGSASEAIADAFATTSGDPFAPPDKALIEEVCWYFHCDK